MSTPTSDPTSSESSHVALAPAAPPASSPPETPTSPTSPPTPSPRTSKSLWSRWTRSGGNFLILSIALHVVLLLGATLWVVQTIQAKRKLSFQSAPPTGAQKASALEYRVQAAKRSQSVSAPPTPGRITTSATSAKIALPEAPAFNPATSGVPSRIAGLAGTGLSFASSASQGAMSAMAMNAIGLHAFGLRTAATGGLTGTFYDLKQTPLKAPLNTPSEAVDDLRTFVKQWDPSTLSKYFRSRQQLYLQRFYFPEIEAVEATKAFGVDAEVKPSFWIAHYQGKVVPTRSGTFRFRGETSDWLVVRFDNKNVFDGGSSSVFVLDPEVNQAKSVYVNLVENRAYNMEVLIGSYPGGVVYANLFLEEKGKTYESDSSGKPLWPLFQVGKQDPPNVRPGANHAPPFAKDPVLFRSIR